MRKYTLVLATVCFVLVSLLLQTSVVPVHAVTTTPRPIKVCHMCDEGLPIDSTPTPQPAAHFWFFYDSGCPPCIKTLNEVLPPILSGYQVGQVVVHAWDMAQKGRELRFALEARYGRAAQEIPVVFIGDDMLAGDQEIQRNLAPLIDKYLAQGGVALPQLPTPAKPSPTGAPAAVVQLANSTAAQPPASDKVIIYFFWGDGCPHCADEKPFLERLKQQYPVEVRAYEVWNVPENQSIFIKMAAAHGFEPGGVPTTFIGERHWVGYSDRIGREIEAAVKACLASACSDAGQGIVPGKSPLATPTSAPSATPTPRPVARAVLFWMDGCPHCHEVIDQVLPPLQQKYGDQLNVHLIEVKSQQDIDQLYQIGAALNIPKQDVGVPFLVIGDKALVGSAQIPAELPALIEGYLAAGGVDYPNLPGMGALLPTAAPRPAMAQPQVTATATPAVAAQSSRDAPPSASFAARPVSEGFELAIGIMVGMVVALVYAGATFGRAWYAKRGRAPRVTLRVPAWTDALTPVLTIIGLGVAGYLAYVETQAVPAACGPVGDCNAVQASSYAKLFGVLPVGVFGMLGYIAILVAWLWGRLRSDRLADYAPLGVLGMTGFGVLFSLYLAYLEPFVIKAVCAWCLTSAVIMTLLMLLAVGPAVETIVISNSQDG